MFFTLCSEEVSYVHCYAAAPFAIHPGKFLWSTTAAPIRTPLLDVRPGTLSMRKGRGSAAGVAIGALNIDNFLFFLMNNFNKGFSLGNIGSPCINFGFECYGWVSQPTSDPLVFWPPVGDDFIDGPFDVPLPPDAYVMRNISQPISGLRKCFLIILNVRFF
jgi:hypothetical protein